MFQAPNGCAYCGIEAWDHCQRYDGLHPSGNHGYNAPSNALRLKRMKENRVRRLAMLDR